MCTLFKMPMVRICTILVGINAQGPLSDVKVNNKPSTRHHETMPTSSQAMIIKNRDLDETLWRRTSSRTINPCPVKNVDINNLFESPFKDFGAQILDRYLGQGNRFLKEKLSKVIKIRGFRTVLSYDVENKSFGWKFVPADAQKTEETKNPGIPARPKTGIARNTDIEKSTLRDRAKSAATMSAVANDEKEDKKDSEIDLPEDIISLGFRSPNRKFSRVLSISNARVASAPALSRRQPSHTESKQDGFLQSWIEIPSRTDDRSRGKAWARYAFYQKIKF